MNECVRYTLPIPYPDVQNIQPNPSTARLLLGDYAGPDSELTAITQYLYQSVCAARAGRQELSELLECLAMTEMRHLKLLAKTIAALGVEPRYVSYQRGRPMWWSSNIVRYESSPSRMIALSLAGERAAVRAYRQRLNQVRDEQVRQILERIAADEEHHVQLLTLAAAQC